MADNSASNTKVNRFQLIGIRILVGCDPSIRKVLKEGVTYFFVDGYKDDGENFIRKLGTENDALETLYDIKGRTEDYKERDIHVNISAIVGKNGCGKSTLLEVMLRVLNNFAKACNFGEKHKTLRQVNKPVNACLYYQYEGKIITIKSEGDKIEYYENGGSALSLPDANDSEAFKNLFYSIVVNYSLYAYNDNMFVDETKHEDTGEYQEKSWIAALYHKNDAYQTPVNITPMRTDGNIDINEENRLSRQRLMALYTYAGEKLDSRIINESTIDKDKGITDDNEIAIGFACTLDNRSKLWTKCIDGYFKEVSSVKLVDVLGKISNKTLSATPKFLSYFHSQISKIKAFSTSTLYSISDYKAPGIESTDLQDLLYRIHNYSMIAESTKKSKQSNINQTDKNLDWMNLSQLIRLCVICIIWNELVKIGIIGKRRKLFDGVSFNIADSKYAAELYIVYKIIHIIETYYKREIDIVNVTDWHINSFSAFKKKLISIVRDITNNKNDYTTLKLQQTINYLKHQILKYESITYETNPDAEDKKFLNQEKYIDFKKLKDCIYQANRIKDGDMQLQEITKFLPPPILVGDIVIQHKGEYYGLSSLSSGETQRLYTISSILYHLRNLDFKQTDKTKIQYKNVSLVFDETEQYFHPEFQRTFVNYLLKQLENASFEQIENINILLVTHSPFMLSDIQQHNILYLEGGECVNDEVRINPYAANVNEILHQSFFLKDAFMGEYALNRIGKLIEIINDLDKNSTCDIDKLKQEINHIGDKFLCQQLTTLLSFKENLLHNGQNTDK